MFRYNLINLVKWKGENMLSVELDDLIKQIIKTKAESQTVEVKAAHGGTPKRLYDTLSSFFQSR